ncbi:phosphodiesterase [Pararobbsia silviterrae]|uniref:Phosphodiesterase n=1 Tax=Pararobbsia silviterrae TaxID=1792498 RepID=A0A494XRX8_9BURK|nr:phosphodiesterase [Pararobbsia silviterrae]RKP50283.1 phosphodiesterase [Pararobbsia silviterrae]
MRLAQISDLHIKPVGELAYDSIDTADFLARAVDGLNALGDQIDAVIATGDLVDAGRPDEYAHLRTHLDRLAKPCYLMVGNHDARAPLRDAFHDHLYLRDGGAFVQYAFDVGPLHVIALDSLNDGESSGTLCAARLDWLRTHLEHCRERPVVIALHHPPFETGIAEMDSICLAADDARAFAQIVHAHPNIERVIAGHVHRAIVRRFGGTIASTCPSTAHQVALDFRAHVPLGHIMEPPGFAIHDWQPDRGLVTHYAPLGQYGKATPY